MRSTTVDELLSLIAPIWRDRAQRLLTRMDGSPMPEPEETNEQPPTQFVMTITASGVVSDGPTQEGESE